MNSLFPLFESSDRELNITYNYRCELYGKHLKTTPEGYVISEFLPDVPWAGIYNTISCAAMHHFRDGRWMLNVEPLDQYARFWCYIGDPRKYSFPIADSIDEYEKVKGDHTVSDALYGKLEEIHRAWDDHKVEGDMYRQLCDRDGMEYSISGNGIRPTINSYMYADKVALAKMAERARDAEGARRYSAEASALRTKINERLWNPKIGMFGVISDTGTVQNVREQIGYVPWIYGIADSGKDSSFRYLLDPDCFLAPFGLRTADASHPDYMKPFNHECLWNGPIWPFATAQTLTALIAYLHGENDPTVSKEDFMKLLLTYSASHRDEDGTPWLDENMHPDTGVWLARAILREWGRKDKDRGLHYNHSTFIDLVFTGICGICPSDEDELTVHPLGTVLDSFSARGVRYHGHSLDIEWNKREGLKVTVDEASTYTAAPSDDVRLKIKL